MATRDKEFVRKHLNLRQLEKFNSLNCKDHETEDINLIVEEF